MEQDFRILTEVYQIAKGPIIHAGAHLLHEAPIYDEANFTPVFWVEALPHLIEPAREIAAKYRDHFVLEGLLWESSNLEKTFFVASNEFQSSSILPLGEHPIVYPGIYFQKSLKLNTTTLNSFKEFEELEIVSLLVIDVQGAEYEVLLGSTRVLPKVQSVFLEVSLIPMYKNQKTFWTINDYLVSNDFTLVKHDLTESHVMGDALYVKNQYLKNNPDFVEVTLPLKKRSYNNSWKSKIRRILMRLGLDPKFISKSNLTLVFRAKK